MKKFLVLEDDPERVSLFMQKLGKNMKWVADAQQAIDALKKEHFDVIFLDHDLGGEVYVNEGNENTGSAVVRWMVANAEKVGDPCIIVHSLNTPAAHNMMLKLVDAGFEYVTEIPFTRLKNEMSKPEFLC